MAKTTSHRLVFTRDRSLNLGDALTPGLRDDQGARLPLGGRCMVDSILHLQATGHYVVSVSHYPPEGGQVTVVANRFHDQMKKRVPARV